jgi:hypothetical protein
MVYTVKQWHEKYPTRFGVIFLLLYGALDVADARWFIPKKIREAKECELSVSCQNWIKTKEADNDHLPRFGFGIVDRGLKSD